LVYGRAKDDKKIIEAAAILRKITGQQLLKQLLSNLSLALSCVKAM